MRLALALSLSTELALSAIAAPQPLPVHGMPKILSIVMPADHDFYAGQTIHSSVVTTPNVGYVEARINYRNAPFHRDGIGKFSLAYTIPWWLPPWLKHAYTLQVIARSVDGVEVKEYLPIRIR